ncbi:unnamed protein product [Pleuronectes platessa]|uniref:Uncharacterized protein n=1 Tax=Pleuronectes platessa TaxID=8262 RepID=A0A9N7VEL7_PLEPL|nr:unnamed protein product [Pleuronectes platessa]
MMHPARPRVIADMPGRSLSVIINADLDVFPTEGISPALRLPSLLYRNCYSTFVTSSSVSPSTPKWSATTGQSGHTSMATVSEGKTSTDGAEWSEQQAHYKIKLTRREEEEREGVLLRGVPGKVQRRSSSECWEEGLKGLGEAHSPPFPPPPESRRPPHPPFAQGAKMSCRRRCKREIFKFAQYLYRFVTGTLNTGKTPGRTLRHRVPFHSTCA